MSVRLGMIRNCLEGAIPAVIATLSEEGVPNVAYLSHVHYVDADHVALSFQFFNKTRENILVNPRAMVQLVDPMTGGHFRLALEYLRTETEGPLFETMKARLASIASHSGMSKIFRLRGSDVYRVVSIEEIAGSLPAAESDRDLLPALRACTQRLGACTDLATLLDETLLCLRDLFGMTHAMMLMADHTGARLYTVASMGYPESGVGSEIPMGAGVIGVAARERTPIRISHATNDYAYSLAVRQSFLAQGDIASFETEIPYPGMPEPHSQLAVPMLLGSCLVGVLYVESAEDLRFTYEDEDILVAIAGLLAMAVHIVQSADAVEERAAQNERPAPPPGDALTIRYYPENHSIFLADDYLIKGVAGAIFWKLIRDYVQDGRTEFSNRQLRLDPEICLPEISDNLEARLILLQRRLAERGDAVQLVKTGRGRFQLRVDRPVRLAGMSAHPA